MGSDRPIFIFFITDTNYLHVYVPDNRYAEPIFIYCYRTHFTAGYTLYNYVCDKKKKNGKMLKYRWTDISVNLYIWAELCKSPHTVRRHVRACLNEVLYEGVAES